VIGSLSRYSGTPVASLELPDGTRVAYLRRRFVPPSERFTLLLEHIVKQGERIDRVAAQYLGDPEQFWRVCDANDAIEPNALTDTLGRTIRITMPEGISVPRDAR
jgi:hypothetical protein